MQADNTPTTCLSCSSLLGCPLLGDQTGSFVPERVIHGNEDRCLEWRPATPQQLLIRETLYGLQGDNCVRVLHQMPSTIMEELNGSDMSDMPDFRAMLREGMTKEERIAQLLHETDENGEVILNEDGNPLRRSNLAVRKFACDQNSHSEPDWVPLRWDVGVRWTTDKIVKYIVEQELNLGFIVKPKKKSTKNAAKKAAPKKEKEKMPAAGKRVLLGRGRKPQAAAEEPEAEAAPTRTAKVGRPPKRRGATHDPAESDQGAPGNGNGTGVSDSVGVVTDDDVDKIKVATAEGVEPVIVETVNRLEARIDALEKVLTQTVVNLFTIQHDLLIQTGGTMADDQGPLDPCWDNPRKILQYLDGMDPESLEVADSPQS